MKLRIISTVILFLVLPFIVLAENSDIQFMGIPWGLEYRELCDKLSPDFGSAEYTTDADFGHVYDISQIITGKTDVDYEKGISGTLDFYPDNASVGGYKINHVECFFANRGDNTACYAARYEISPIDIEGSMSDLKAKLTSIYGDSSDFGSGTVSFFDCEWYIWTGANNTGIALVQRKLNQKQDWFTDMICINYFTRHGDEWLKEASNTVSSRNAEERAENVSGL